MKKYKYAIEMGGGYTNIYVKGQGLALKEPTLVGAEPTEEGYKVIALGQDAKKLIGKTKENIEIFTPCVYGEHSNFEYSVVLLKHLLSKVGFKQFEDNVLFLCPCGITAREKDNILRVCEAVNMGQVEIVPAVVRFKMIDCTIQLELGLCNPVRIRPYDSAKEASHRLIIMHGGMIQHDIHIVIAIAVKHSSICNHREMEPSIPE